MVKYRIGYLHVPVSYSDPVDILGVVLHAVSHSQNVKLRNEDCAAPVEALLAALKSYGGSPGLST